MRSILELLKILLSSIDRGVQEETEAFYIHKSDDVVCRTFYDKLGHYSQGIRIAERLNMLKFVEHTDNKKLKSYSEI